MSKVLTFTDINKLKVGNLDRGVDLTVYDSSARYTLGELAFGDDGKVYRYVQFLDAVTYAAGHVVTRAHATDWKVTNDRSGGSAVSLEVVGVVLGVPTQNQYGWVQVAGVASVLAGAANIAAGDTVKADASTDGAADEMAVQADTAAWPYPAFGVATAAMTDTQNGTVRLFGLL